MGFTIGWVIRDCAAVLNDGYRSPRLLSSSGCGLEFIHAEKTGMFVTPKPHSSALFYSSPADNGANFRI
jgi:hypothetical protein